MLKVLQICNKAPFPANDGSSIAIYNMARGFIENQVELHLLIINTKKHFKDDAKVPENFREKSHYVSVYKNTNTGLLGAFLNLFAKSSYFVSRFHFKLFENKLRETLSKSSFDIIQLEGLFMGSYIESIKKYSKAKIVLRAHNIEHLIWQRHISHNKSLLRKTYLRIQIQRLKQFELEVIAQVDAIVPITPIDELEFKKLGFKKPMYSCITGVDIDLYQEKTTFLRKPKTIFYFGSMDWLPNQEAANWFLQNCWERIHHAVPDAKFIIAGRGMPLEFFHITKPNVQIMENVENGKLFFLQNEIMVVPLQSGSGLRIKIIEGMSYGKAIVSTTIGAEGINCINGKNILIADAPSDFADAVIRLLNNQSDRESIEREASSFAASEFDNRQVVSRLVQFYNQLLHV
ncbi:MAG: glycosyltransferase family 4 protein [bacterium]|nr:glycosyltransferase family 4 protein [bacterium]